MGTRRQGGAAFVLSTAITLIFAGLLLGQSIGTGQLPQTEPSPLSEFSPTSELIEQLNHPGKPFTRGNIVTKEVDLQRAIRGYAALKRCSWSEAFRETASFLKMVPIKDEPAENMLSAGALYSVVNQDVYRITASQSFFDRLPENLRCIENGKRHLSLQVQILEVSAENRDSFRSFMIPGSFASFNNKFPQAKPYATAATYQDVEQSAGGLAEPVGTFVVASETKTKVFPTFMGRLDGAGVEKLISHVQSDASCAVTFSTSIRAFPGQTASISEAHTRPFVVGLNEVVGSNKHDGEVTRAHEPVIQAIEEGTVLRVRATGEAGQIRLDGDLALSEIQSVETFEYPAEPAAGSKHNGSAPEENQRLTVQVPEQKLKQVHLSTLVKEGQTVLIDPVFQRASRGKSIKEPKRVLKTKANANSRQARVLLMITPRFVDVNAQNDIQR